VERTLSRGEQKSVTFMLYRCGGQQNLAEGTQESGMKKNGERERGGSGWDFFKIGGIRKKAIFLPTTSKGVVRGSRMKSPVERKNTSEEGTVTLEQVSTPEVEGLLEKHH